MGWSIGYDSNWKRHIGYGVPAFCDHPGCGRHIDRGLSYVCGSQPFGGERGCGLYFCETHRSMTSKGELCARCYPKIRKPFLPTPDFPEWSKHLLKDPTWKKWRAENPDEVIRLNLITGA